MAADPQRTEKSATLILTAALERAALPPEKQSAPSVQPGRNPAVSRISICQDKPTTTWWERFGFRSDKGFALSVADNLQNAQIAANYQTLSEVARIASTAKIAKNKTGNFSDELNEKPKKVLAFVVYSCYKTISPPHWRASFWATCNHAVLKSFVFLQTW